MLWIIVMFVIIYYATQQAGQSMSNYLLGPPKKEKMNKNLEKQTKERNKNEKEQK